MEGTVQGSTPPQCESTMTSSTSGNNLVAQDNKFTDPNRPLSLLKGLGALYEQKLFVDVTLMVGDKRFQCHKNVLAISSPYFMTMFSTDLRESQQDELELKEMEGSTMELILDYIYTGQVMLSENSVQHLLSAANLFQLLALRNGCAEYMIKHVTVSNCIGVYFFARAHQCDQLATKAKELINSQFEQLFREQEFQALPPDKLIEIIQDDQLNVNKEETVYEACLLWLSYSLDERKPHLYDVMKHVRFANISSYYFCDNIDSVRLLQESPELVKVLNTVKYYHMLKNRQSEIDLNYLPRKGMSYERGVIIMANPYTEDNSRKFNSMEILLPRTGVIKHLCKLPQSLYMPAACTTGDNQIYLAGGAIRKINYRGPFITEGVSQNLFLFDKNFGSWQVRAKMIQGRCQFALVVVDGTLYAIGGQNETDLLDTVECYDQQLNTWRTAAPLPQKLRCMTAVGYKGRIYVFGGEHEGEITNVAYRYDPGGDAWLNLPPMQSPRALAGSVVYEDKIYVIGGNSATSTKWKKEFLPEHCVSMVEIFDPATSTWGTGPELPNALCGAGVVKYGDSILVVGGEDDKSWMAGLFMLRRDASAAHPEGSSGGGEGDGEKSQGKGQGEHWVEGQELPMVLSTFACVIANIPRELVHDIEDL